MLESSARQLHFIWVQRGAQVTILDAAEPGQGTSAVSFAWINSRNKNPRHYHDLNRRSIDMWDRFARRLGGDVGLSWGGELQWVAKPDEVEGFRARVKLLQSWGYPIELLEPAAVRELEPGVNAGQIAAASISNIDGQVEPKRVIHACIAGAVAKGATVRSQTTVSELRQDVTSAGSIQITGVECGHDSFACEMLVIAGGPDTPVLAALAGLTVPLYHTFGATLVTEPMTPLLKRVSVVHAAHELCPELGVRQLPDGSLIIHGGTGDRSMGRTEAEVDQVLAAAIQYFPALDGVSIREVRRGRRPIPQDGLPILGFSEAAPNLYLAVMHSGVTLAPLVGEFAAIEMLDRVRIDLLEPYRLERFAGPS